MSKPPATPPSSDIDGANRDARVGSTSKDEKPNSGGSLGNAKEQGTARPQESKGPA